MIQLQLNVVFLLKVCVRSCAQDLWKSALSKQEIKQFHHGSGWKKFCCCIEDIMPPWKWRINHDNLLEEQEEMFSCGFKRERPAGAGSERSFSCRVHCELKCWGSRERGSRGGRASVVLAAWASSPAGITGHGLSGCATDGIRPVCAALMSVQKTEPEVENRKKGRNRTFLLPVYGELYTKLMMICDCWTPHKCLCVLFCRVFLRGGCLDIGFGLFNGFWIAFLMLTKHPKPELSEPIVGRMVSACSMSIC